MSVVITDSTGEKTPYFDTDTVRYHFTINGDFVEVVEKQAGSDFNIGVRTVAAYYRPKSVRTVQ